jgi:hypothetical protein
MSRYFAIALALAATTSPLSAQSRTQSVAAAPKTAEAVDAAPEMLLSPTSQLFVRWDGIAAHNDAYKKSIWGGVMAGPTGDSIRAMMVKGPKLLGANLLSEPLLEGKAPKDLKANLTDLKNASKIIDLVADKGAVVAAEVREPRPTLKGIGSAIGGLFGGGKLPGAEALIPDAYVLAIVPDAGNQAETFYAAIRLLLKKNELTPEPFAIAGRSGFQMQSHLHVAWWVEGKHFVVYAGSMKPEAMVAEMTANPSKGGVTAHPLYVRCRANPGYESITRGFVDANRVVGVAKSLAGPFVPGLSQRLDDLGLGNLKAIVFNSGFDGKESRATYEFEVSGERKGFAKVLKPQPITLKDLPPMPPDVSRFSALRIDPAALYEAGIVGLETLSLNTAFDGEDKAKTPAEKLTLRREEVAKQFDRQLGLSIKDDVVPYLGDTVVVFQSPTEGLSLFGTTICVKVTNPAKVKLAADRVQQALENIISAPIKVRKKTLRGYEIRELYSRGFGVLTPTVAVLDDWLVVSFEPQCVQGIVLRLKGEIPSWKPDDATAARLAKMAPGCGLQYCDPRSTVQNLCCIGPIIMSAVELQKRFLQTESDYNPFDTGLIPNGHELSKHLFPNLTVTRDDGKTIRVEVNESFSLPLEALGFELFTAIGFFGFLVG